MSRVYVRKFDWDEARRLRAQGWTYARIAARFGVTHNAVYCACNDEHRERQKNRHAEYERSRSRTNGSRRKTESVIDKIAKRFEIDPNGCWNWTAAISRKGYPFVWVRGSRPAHRLAYELLVGPIPEGLTLDHLCRNRRCVNPDHLEPVTNRENVLRGNGHTARNARKTHCKRGHAFDSDNTLKRPDGSRACRTCMRARERERWHLRKVIG